MLARRIFADGRTRAYAWGRSAAREDVAAVAEALIAMSGQFEQRRLARPGYQRDGARRVRRRRHRGGPPSVARAAGGPAQARRADPRRRRRARARSRARGARRRHRRARARPRGRAARGARAATPPRRAGRGRRGGRRGARAGGRRRRHRPHRRCRARRRAARAPCSGARSRRARRCGRRSCNCARPPRTCARSCSLSRPSRAASKQVEGELERLADLQAPPRRPDADRAAERGEAARQELAALADGHDPAAAAAEALERAEGDVAKLHAELRRARRTAAEPFAAAVAAELAEIGLGDGEFQVVLGEREPGASGRRRGLVPDPAERRPPVRPRRRDRLGR